MYLFSKGEGHDTWRFLRKIRNTVKKFEDARRQVMMPAAYDGLQLSESAPQELNARLGDLINLMHAFKSSPKITRAVGKLMYAMSPMLLSDVIYNVASNQRTQRIMLGNIRPSRAIEIRLNHMINPPDDED
jgi:hypothetical protein